MINTQSVSLFVAELVKNERMALLNERLSQVERLKALFLEEPAENVPEFLEFLEILEKEYEAAIQEYKEMGISSESTK